MKTYTTLLAFIFPFFVFSQNHLLSEIPLPQQVEMANIIAEGQVIAKTSHWDKEKKNIYTVYTIEVSKSYKGAAENQMHIVTPGGVVGLKAQVVKPSLQLNIKDAGVFMATSFELPLEGVSTSVPLYKPVGSTQGFYRYNKENASVIHPFSSFLHVEILNNTLQTLTRTTPKTIKNVLYFHSQKKKNVLQIQTSAGINTTAINSISPLQIVAGNNSVLTITGTGFGTTMGSVRFKNADDGGSTRVTALESQILLWTDTEIRVEVPEAAGSGDVEVVTSTNTYSFSGLVVTHSYISVNFTDTNYNINNGKESQYRPLHVGSINDGQTPPTPMGNFDNGAYVFQYHTDFNSNTAAVTSFENGFNPIVCQAGIDFKISTTTTTAKNAEDNINAISFDTVDAGVLGQAISRLSGEYFYNSNNQIEIHWFFYEIDYVFNTNINWDFTLDGNTSFSAYDFNAVVRHETGHAAGLGHVIDTQKLMHYAFGAGPYQSTTSNSIFDPIRSKINEDKLATVTNTFTLTDFSDCYTLSTNEVASHDVIAYPNPVENTLYISSKNSINTVTIYTLNGKMVRQVIRDDGAKTHAIEFDVRDLNTGVYFATLIGEKGTQTLKFIKN